MGPFGVTTRARLAWLLAALTPLAAVPRTECHCPDGRVMAFCPGPGGTPSCTGGGCRAAPERMPATATSQPLRHGGCSSCCCRDHGEPSDPTSVRAGGCVKVVVPAPPVSGVKAAAPVELSAPVAPFVPDLRPAASDCPVCWRPSTPPHPDLVTLLCRLTC